jgi:predicted DCC family thiol-disulfide oxidoreductase YuxK
LFIGVKQVMTDSILTIFYDGKCPLCCLEMEKLKRHDTNNQIILVNIHNQHFKDDFPSVDTQRAMAILHGLYQGNILLGLDVTHRAWTLVGKGMWVAPLQFPIIKQLSHGVYLLLAKYRQPISRFIHQKFGLGASHCKEGTCYDNTNNRR